jgi:hypothetical protein
VRNLPHFSCFHLLCCLHSPLGPKIVPVDGNTVLAESDVLPGGHVVSRGTEVLYSAYVMHRLPELWPEPETFNPDRCSGIRTSVFPSSFPPTLFIGWCATSSRRAHELAPECGYFLHTRVCVRASPGSSRPPSPSRTCRSTEAPGCAWAWTWRTWKPRCVVASEQDHFVVGVMMLMFPPLCPLDAPR